MKITFGDLELTEVFKVVDVHRMILPPRTNYSIDVPAKHGHYYTGFKYNPREILVDVIMISDNINANLRALAWMLDNNEPTPLTFSDEPDKVYYAIVDGGTNISQILKVGKGQIKFLCLDPFAYSKEEKAYTANNEGKILIVNGGTAPTAPKFEIDFTSDCGFISIVSPRGIIQIGNSKNVDTSPSRDSERLINDAMTSLTGYSVNTNGKVRTNGATIQGTLQAKDSTIRPLSYGTPTNGWHGMTLRRELPKSGDGTSTAQYWETSFTFRFRSDEYFGFTSAEKQMGKIEFNVMDESNNFIAGFSMSDTMEGYNFNVPEFYVGDTKIWEDKPSIPPANTIRQYNEETGKYDTKTVNPTSIGKWNSFYGKVIIRHEKNKFYFELQVLEGDTMDRVLSRTSRTYYDESGTFNNTKAKAVNIWFGKYKDYPEVSLNYGTHLTFRKDYVAYKDIPNTFGTGDRLVVDCDTSLVYLNNSLFMDKVDVGSQFFEVVEGDTEIFILDSSYSSKPIVTAKIKEKFL